MLKKPFFFIVLLLTSSRVAIAGWELSPSADVGSTSADLNWTIAGSLAGTNPNIVSELIWRDLDINTLQLNFTAHWENNIFLRANMSFGDITSGTVQDSDYNLDNRQDEFSRSISSANAGSTFGQQAGAGLPFNFFQNKPVNLFLAPMVGFSYREQNLRMTNGTQVVSDNVNVPPAGTQLTGLDSRYETEWRSIWFGLDLKLNWLERHAFYNRLEVHVADYYAKAKWNLRADFAQPLSFAHDANGIGLVQTFGYEASLYRGLSIGANLHYEHWETDAGIATFYFSDGTASSTRFNGAVWESTTVNFHIGYQFSL